MQGFVLVPWLEIKVVSRTETEATVALPDHVRACGDCLLCCKVMPVGELAKPANRWCQHAKKGAGCGIYEHAPMSCRAWSCLWLMDADLPDALRPRKSHVIFDMLTDVVQVVDKDGQQVTRRVVQLWVDPAYPAAHRAPEVRDAIANIAAKHRMATLVRIGSSHGFVVVPPSLSGGDWQEVGGTLDDDRVRRAPMVAEK